MNTVSFETKGFKEFGEVVDFHGKSEYQVSKNNLLFSL